MLRPSLTNKIVEGDVREVLRRLSPDDTFDCVITSPPYFQLREYTGLEAEIGTEETIHEYLDALIVTFELIHDSLKSTGSLWVNLGDTFDNGQPQCIPWTFMQLMLSNGWQLRNIVIWDKPDAMAESGKRRFSQKYEPFFWFTKTDDYYFNFEAATIPCKRSTVERLENEFNAGKGTDVSRMRGMLGDMSHKVEQYLQGGVNTGDVWTIATNKEHVEHIAPYPIELIVRPIVATCPPKGIVFDPFVGSGTTALGTLKVGGNRKFFGVDIDHDAVVQASLRVEDELKQGTLF